MPSFSRQRRLAGAALAAALVAVAGCAPRPRPVAPAALPSLAAQRLLDPRPQPSGLEWLGGDVASSTPLAADRYVWIFGDTLLGQARRDCPPATPYCGRRLGNDPDATMIANSAGIMRFDGPGRPRPLATFWRTIDGRPAPIFAADDGEAFLWPLAVLRAGKPLLVAASLHTRATGLFSLGSVLIRIPDPDTAPNAWRYTRHRLPNTLLASDTARQLTWATALVPGDGVVYLVGEHGVGVGSETVLARFSTAGIDADAWQPMLEYLSALGDGTAVWRRSCSPATLHAVAGLPGVSEASFERLPDGTWRTYRIPAGTFEIRRYTATALWGPWRDLGVVARIPAPWSTERRPDGSARFAAYAVKAHPELGSPEHPVLTYNVNITDGSFESAVREAIALPAFYVPRAVLAP